ncbi:Nudix hydrolase domain-containing protein [Flavobacterium longum]|uniref:NUDIX domain-containing protein n=1 Tax=Flavobacterium longum TaxID=1299340 RepID=UPI0039EBDB92
MKQSAGILVYRESGGQLEFFLVHPGGPFWKNKDVGAWSIPKGEFTDDENPLDAAVREFAEETGHEIAGEFFALNPVKLKSGKTILAWAVEGDIDANAVASNTFEMEWPPKSGKIITVPEVDKADWFNADDAVQRVNPAQTAFLLEIQQKTRR